MQGCQPHAVWFKEVPLPIYRKAGQVVEG